MKKTMMIKTLQKLTALLLLWGLFALPLHAETKKQYQIKGAELSHKPLSGTQTSYKVKGTLYTTHSRQSAKNYSKEGVASYYHKKFTGRRTANGETYQPQRFTAAHKTLPMNSYAVVTNLRNGRKVVVRINDRGPFSQKRIIDLSYAAAKEIGLIQRGIGKVKVEALHVDRHGKISGAGTQTLAKHAQTQKAADRLVMEQSMVQNRTTAQHSPSTQSGAAQRESYKLKALNFSSKSQAEQFVKRLKLNQVGTEISKNGQKYEVYFGPFQQKTAVNALKTQIQVLTQTHPLIIYTYK